MADKTESKFEQEFEIFIDSKCNKYPIQRIETDFYIWLAVLPPGKYKVVAGEAKKIKSRQLEKYFHGVIIKLIFEKTGEPKERIKSFIKCGFLGVEEVFGEMVVQSSAKLLHEDYWDMCLWAIEWAESFLKLIIPLPDPDLRKL